jgi:excisionase family DNA binding protein
MPETLMEDRLLTIPEVAEALRCHPASVYRMVNTGKLAAVALGDGQRRGRMLRVPASALTAMLERVNAT